MTRNMRQSGQMGNLGVEGVAQGIIFTRRCSSCQHYDDDNDASSGENEANRKSKGCNLFP